MKHKKGTVISKKINSIRNQYVLNLLVYKEMNQMFGQHWKSRRILQNRKIWNFEDVALEMEKNIEPKTESKTELQVDLKTKVQVEA